MTTVRLELGPDPDPAAVSRAVGGAVLQEKVKQLLSSNAQADRTVRSHGNFTPDEAAILKQAAAAGLLKKGLVKVEIEDPYSHSRRIEFYGDDEGATWHAFANPLRIGKFATPNKATMGAPPRSTTAWYEGY